MKKESTGNGIEHIPPQDLIKHKRIGGWLAFFIFALFVFNPLRLIVATITQVRELNINHAIIQSLLFQIVSYFEIGTNIGIAMFSIYAGYCLYKLKKNAVLIAKTFIIVALFSNVVSMIMPTLISAQGYSMDQKVIADIIRDGIRGIIVCIIWFAYFCVSKRVAATYFSSRVVNSEAFVVNDIKDKYKDNAPVIVNIINDQWICPSCGEPSLRVYDICKNCGQEVIKNNEKERNK